MMIFRDTYTHKTVATGVKTTSLLAGLVSGCHSNLDYSVLYNLG